MPDTLWQSIGVEAVLANTYHLHGEPGQEILKAAGGFAPFMNWKGPTMTDSGGFSLFALVPPMKKGSQKSGAPKLLSILQLSLAAQNTFRRIQSVPIRAVHSSPVPDDSILSPHSSLVKNARITASPSHPSSMGRSFPSLLYP